MSKFALTLIPFLFAAPLHAQKKTTKPKAPAAAKPAPLTPLNPQERAQQLLNRFTFGPRPGDVEQVLAMTPEKWFEQQLNPAGIPDPILDKRLNDYTTLNLQPDQALQLFPDRFTISQVADGKRPSPTDSLVAAMYEVQTYKLNRDIDTHKLNPDGQPVTPPPTEAEAAAQKKTDQETAARIAGELFALPKNQRMAALIKLPIPDRIAFTTHLAAGGALEAQKNLLINDFNPREREIFNGMAANIGAPYNIVNELSQAKILRAILSERQLQEVMTDFWFNHFNIYIGKDSDQWYTTSYEHDAIRKHALGKFRELLIATATSPAMMIYLDNWLSIGPDSLANGVNPANPNAKRGNRGLNENYGREVMELHTLGVDGGYTQADVTALSAILTGWTVDRPNQAGPFLYDPKKHEPGPKQWFGYTISTSDFRAANVPPDIPTGMNEGVEALTLLAANPHTAHFISYKLAQRFVADDPPPALVDRMAATYLATDGDIKAILRTLVQSPEFNSRKYFRNKIKTPFEFVASAFRTTATDPANPGALVNTLNTMGMRLYYALPPTGYYITADHWVNSTALVDRLNFAYALTGNKFANQKFDSAHVLALGLMAQPATANSTTAANTPHAKYSEAVLTTELNTSLPNRPPNATGQDIALHVLESTLIGGDVSPQTSQLIRKQIAGLPATNSTETLNLYTALVMGSPEFQLR
jgi:uncharacterized protein (DUF1800 family)